MRRQLKNYDLYLNKIKALSQALGIKIEWRTDPSDGTWLPQHRKIRIDPDLTDTETIATLLHEFGHIIDDSSLDDKTLGKLGKSYSVIYTDVYTTKDVDVVAATEIRAWNYGCAIAKNLGINRGKWYDKMAKEAIKNYKQLERKAS